MMRRRSLRARVAGAPFLNLPFADRSYLRENALRYKKLAYEVRQEVVTVKGKAIAMGVLHAVHTVLRRQVHVNRCFTHVPWVLTSSLFDANNTAAEPQSEVCKVCVTLSLT